MISCCTVLLLVNFMACRHLEIYFVGVSWIAECVVDVFADVS